MPKTTYVCMVTPLQVRQLRELLDARGWEFLSQPYAHWRARHGKVQVVAYESGKLTVQGAETEDFVRFILEPEILHEARLDYEPEREESVEPRMFEPHAGIDESGKGDFFGPLCVACVYTDASSAKALLKAGVRDSKQIKTDAQVQSLAETIRTATQGRFRLVTVGPAAYNRLYASFGNLNRLLAWGHATALEGLLEKVPSCPRAISDQFAASASTVQRALRERGRRVELEQHPRAEADVAVAAASILARAEFIRRMEELGKGVIGKALPRGASAEVTAAGREIVRAAGAGELGNYAKLHFKTTAAVTAP